MKRPSERSATVDAAMAIVGAVRTKTLLMLVPSRMREVRTAQAARMANWSPPWPSASQAEFVAQSLGQHDEIDDLGRVGAARYGDADPSHGAPHRPLNTGSRFSTKALAASRWSSVWPQWMWWVASRSRQSSTSPAMARLRFSFM